MLLKYLIEPVVDNTFETMLYCTWSPDQSPIMRSKCKFTESFLRLKFNPNHRNNIIINDGVEPMNRILWHVSTMPNISKVCWVQPGLVLYYEFILLVNKYSNPDNNQYNTSDWGMIKSEHNAFAILNPLNNDCFTGDSLEEWEEKCKANNLRVDIIEHDPLPTYGKSGDYDRETFEAYRKVFLDWADAPNEDSYVKDHGLDMRYEEQVRDMTTGEREEVLTYNTKTLVYYDKQKLPKEFIDRFENVIKFSKVSDIEDILNQVTEDVTWVIGMKLVIPETWWRYGHQVIESLVKRILAKKQSVLFGYTLESNDLITTTHGDHSIV